jgi:hypothetical protein
VRRELNVALDLDPELTAWADPTRLRQVLLNLLSNAVKYNREGGGLTVRVHRPAPPRVRVSVTDTGAGIPAAAQGRLFRPFERVNAAFDGVEGTGIGLALAKKLVEAMGGEIDVDSVEGLGSTFWFELPPGTGGAPDPAAAPAVAGALARREGRPRRPLLCVEDNPANLKLVRKVVAVRDDLDLYEAESGEEGLETAAALNPAVILLDISLPGIDGFETLERLRQDPRTRDIPVVAVTANAMPGDLDRAEGAGFSDYLTKPLDVGRLNGVLDRLLSLGPGEPP